MKKAEFGDGTLLKLLIQYLPQIIEALVKAGIIKPKSPPSTQKFGDGQLLKQLIPLLIQLLPLLLMFLGEDAEDISDKP